MVNSFNHRFYVAITVYYLLAYDLESSYFSLKLIDDRLISTLTFVNAYHQNTMCKIIKFETRAFRYKDYLFQKIFLKILNHWLDSLNS